MNRDFLKEAIADAKAVKESAIANAKVALEEAFSPQVQAMFASKLEEMEKDEVDEGYNDVDEALDEAEISEKKEYITKKEKREGDDRKSDNKAETETEKMRKIKEEDVFDLDEILAELENEGVNEDARTDAEEEGYLDGMKDEKEDLKEDERTDAEEEGFLDGEEDEKEDMEDDEDIDLEDMSEDDLKSFIEDVIEDMVESGELEAGESFDEEDVDVEDDIDIEIDDDVEIEEAKKQGYNARLDDAEGAKHGKKKQDMKQRRADSENMEKADGKRKFAGDSQMKEELDLAMETIVTLKSELNEINLLNAKLLYTNKVFRGKNLTETQKVKVLEAFDKAETVKEVKLVFETIDVSVKSKTSNKNIVEGARAKGSASNMTSTPKVTKKQPIVESDEMVARFKKLAGII
tara:strand:- start:266 stop:1483 length:1218 start_codon:yes stop_codon:yes gene_type:complete